jgi:hypothetical protein
MSMVPINWRPDRKTLAEFSEFAMFFLGMVGAPVALLRGDVRLGAILWAAAVAIRLAGVVRPMWLRPVYLGLTLVTWPIGWAVSHLTFALVYFLIFTPIGFLFRLIGRDALHRSFDRGASTYWERHNPNQGPARYLRHF